MVRTERLLPGHVSKLENKGTGPFKVLRRFGMNAYELELPQEYEINPTFNVADLVLYKGPIVVPSEDLEPISPILSDTTNKNPSLAQKHLSGQVDKILDKQTTVTKNKVYQRYLVRWKNQPPTEDT